MDEHSSTPEILATTIGHSVEDHGMETGGPADIRVGDVVLVDTARRQPASGAIFLIEVLGCGKTVGRLQTVGGRHRITSDNPTGPTWLQHEFRIVGQAYGRLRFSEVS